FAAITRAIHPLSAIRHPPPAQFQARFQPYHFFRTDHPLVGAPPTGLPLHTGHRLRFAQADIRVTRRPARMPKAGTVFLGARVRIRATRGSDRYYLALHSSIRPSLKTLSTLPVPCPYGNILISQHQRRSNP